MKRFQTVDEYIFAHTEWTEALKILREIIKMTELEETVKWGAPVYTINGKNVIGLGAFKSYVGLWFYQGAFLKDEKNKLINAQEGKTKGMRQWRFNSINEFNENLIKEYVEEAIQNQKEGKEIKIEKNKPLEIPSELAIVFDENSELSLKFSQLSLSKQREYAEFVSEAKREATVIKRIEKIIPMIMEGKGLNDKYKK